jgi:GWxTD domain-containing protein
LGGKNTAFRSVPILFLSSLILNFGGFQGWLHFCCELVSPQRKDHKMKYLVCLLFFAAVVSTSAQSLNKINFNYLYNQKADVEVQLHPVKLRDSIFVFYVIKAIKPGVDRLLIQWEKNDSYAQRQGAIIIPFDTVRLINGQNQGVLRFQKPAKPWVLVANVANTALTTRWVYYKQVEEHYPVNGYLEKGGEKQFQSYHSASSKYVVRGSGSGKPIHFSYYKDNFPTPSPPFADKEEKIDRFLFPDSTFTISPGEEVGPFQHEGLYLAQEDTMSADGFSFLIKKDPYPKYNKLADLKGPLLFVTTRDENDLIGQAGEDKAKFDKVILDITGDKDRAKNFMRNYFKRVEFANQHFTSYKEGWKTDRGMVYIVFGAPDEVAMGGQQEYWVYRNLRQQFTFMKVGSVYHPDHFVLVRDKDYAENWYLTVDLWRKSRF